MENNIIEQEVNTQYENIPAEATKPAICDESTKPVKVRTYFGLFILFAIPVIGWLACAIMMFAPKSKSLKNYARAFMVKLVLQLAVISLIAVSLVAVFNNMILPSINDTLGTRFTSINELIALVSDTADGNYATLVSTFKPQIIEAVGEEYEPIIDELSKEEYNDLVNQVINGDYEQAMADVTAEKYPALQDALGEESYGVLLDELEAAQNGESAVFDEVTNQIPAFITSGDASVFDSVMGMTPPASSENLIIADDFASEVVAVATEPSF